MIYWPSFCISPWGEVCCQDSTTLNVYVSDRTADSSDRWLWCVAQIRHICDHFQSNDIFLKIDRNPVSSEALASRPPACTPIYSRGWNLEADETHSVLIQLQQRSIDVWCFNCNCKTSAGRSVSGTASTNENDQNVLCSVRIQLRIRSELWRTTCNIEQVLSSTSSNGDNNCYIFMCRPLLLLHRNVIDECIVLVLYALAACPISKPRMLRLELMIPFKE